MANQMKMFLLIVFVIVMLSNSLGNASRDVVTVEMEKVRTIDVPNIAASKGELIENEEATGINADKDCKICCASNCPICCDCCDSSNGPPHVF